MKMKWIYRAFIFSVIVLIENVVQAACMPKNQRIDQGEAKVSASQQYDVAIERALEWGEPMNDVVVAQDQPLSAAQRIALDKINIKKDQESRLQMRAEAEIEQKGRDEAAIKRQALAIAQEKEIKKQRKASLIRSRAIDEYVAEIRGLADDSSRKDKNQQAVSKNIEIALAMMGINVEQKREQMHKGDAENQLKSHNADLWQGLAMTSLPQVLIHLIAEYTSEMLIMWEHRLLAVLPHEQLLIQAADRDHVLKIYDLAQKKEICSLQTKYRNVIRGVALENKMVALMDEEEGLSIFDPYADKIIQRFPGKLRWFIDALYKLPHNRLLIMLCSHSCAVIRDLTTGATIQIVGAEHKVNCMTVFDNSNCVLHGDPKRFHILANNGNKMHQVRLQFPRSLEKREAKEKLSFGDNVAVCSDGRIVTASWRHSNIYLWDQKTGMLIHTLVHSPRVKDRLSGNLFLDGSLFDNKLVSMHDDGLEIWDLKALKVIKRYDIDLYGTPVRINVIVDHIIISFDNYDYENHRDNDRIVIIADPTLYKVSVPFATVR